MENISIGPVVQILFHDNSILALVVFLFSGVVHFMHFLLTWGQYEKHFYLTWGQYEKHFYLANLKLDQWFRCYLLIFLS